MTLVVALGLLLHCSPRAETKTPYVCPHRSSLREQLALADLQEAMCPLVDVAFTRYSTALATPDQ